MELLLLLFGIKCRSADASKRANRAVTSVDVGAHQAADLSATMPAAVWLTAVRTTYGQLQSKP